MQSNQHRENKIIKNFSLWRNIENSQIRLTPLSGGVTNYVYKIDLFDPNNSSKELCTFIYKGIVPNEYTDRDKEVNVLKLLGELGLTSKLYYCSPDHSFRIEEFIPGMVIQSSHMFEPQIIVRCLYALAQLHNVDWRPLFGQNTFQSYYFTFGNVLPCAKSILHNPENYYAKEEVELVQQIKTLYDPSELTYLQSLNKTFQSNPIVFSHNDICYENMILNSQTNEVCLIDWETSFPNYRGFDIGGLFNKRYFRYDDKPPGFKYAGRSSIEWPEINTAFEIYVILDKAIKTHKVIKNIDALNDCDYRKNLECELFPIKEELDRKVKELSEEYKYCSLLMNHDLVSWALSMAGHSREKFDYLRFAYAKFQEYLFFKKEFYG